MESKPVRLWIVNMEKLKSINSNINVAISELLGQSRKDVTKSYSDLIDEIRVVIREELEKVRGY